MYSNLVWKLGPDQIVFYVIITQNQLFLFNLHDSDPKHDPDQSVCLYTFSLPWYYIKLLFHLSIDAWKKVRNQIKNERENKYISAAFYNQAYYIMKKDPKQSEECLKLLEKAKEGFTETMKDAFYDSQLFR